MSTEDQYIIKKINTEQNFSDVVFKSARAERFGITYCCPLDVENASIKKELCDWEDSRLPVYLGKSIEQEDWTPGGGIALPSWGITDCGMNNRGVCMELDIECILFEVINQNGVPIEGYPIVVDGGNVGVTDEYGRFRYSLYNADVNTTHTFDLCYCFETIGYCSQKKITMTLTEECPTEVCADPPEKMCEEPEPLPACDPTSGPTQWPFQTQPCTSPLQATWEFGQVSINGTQAAIGDYIGIFNSVTNALSGWVEIAGFPLSLTAQGASVIAPCSADYLTVDDPVYFVIYDSSECTYCEGIPSTIYPFVPASINVVADLDCL